MEGESATATGNFPTKTVAVFKSTNLTRTSNSSQRESSAGAMAHVSQLRND